MLHAVVVGAGVFGTWTARHLQASGVEVTLIDAYGPASPRASSGDHSRIMRCGYGADEIYSRFARRSLQLWRELAARLGSQHPPIWRPCGVLWLAGREDPYAAATQETLDRGNYPSVVLDRTQLRERYAHLDATDISSALLEPECGVLMARRAVRTLVSELAQNGVRVLRGQVQPPQRRGTLPSVRLADGTDIGGDLFVFACGAWLPKLFPALLGEQLRPTRQVVVYFGAPAGDGRFGPAHTPAWIDFPAGIYGVPDIEDRGVKVGIDEHGPEIDPDTADRAGDTESIARARTWLTRRFPAMADAPVVETRVCQYENTSTGDFLIDRHPGYENVWIVGGGSGHGFKHGPAVGEYAARLVRDEVEPEPRFSLRDRPAAPRRSVF